jgi:prolactin regulatory element-binding protein
MAPKKPKPNTKKFGMPLYASAWADERSLLVAGGGGKKSSGIPNRVCVATFDGETLSEPLFSCHTDETAPQALVMFPDNSRVLCVFGGDVAVYDVTRDPDAPGGEALGEDENADPPARDETTKSPYVVKPARLAADGSAARSKLAACDVKCAAFSSDGAKLAVGLEDGTVAVCEWRDDDDRAGGLAVTSEIGKHADAVTGVCFSPDDDDVLLTTSAESAVSRENAGAALWSVGKKQRLFAFQAPTTAAAGLREKKKKRNARVVASYRAAVFRADGDVATVLNVNGEGYVSRWTPNDVTNDEKWKRWKHAGSIRATRDPVSAAASARDGDAMCLGTSEGDVAVVETGAPGRLRVRARDTSAHMIFVTTVAFSTDGGFILSGSADASARCVSARRVSVAAATARILAGFATLALSFLFLTLFLRRGGVAGFLDQGLGTQNAPVTRPDSDGGVDLMSGLDLADAAAQAREALREMADEAARKAAADAAVEERAPTPPPSEDGGARGGEGYPADDTERKRSEAFDPDPNDFFEEASSETTPHDSAPREEL